MEKKQKVATVLDVARVAGVSPATVSRVLNRSSVVAKDKREKVLSAVEALGFLPNRSARVLRMGRDNLVAVLVADIEQRVYSGLIRHLQIECESVGLDLMVYDLSHSARRLLEFVRKMSRLKLFGVVLATTDSIPEDVLATLRAQGRDGGTKMVSVRQRLDGSGIATIVHDDRKAARDVAALLLGRGCMPLAFSGRISGSMIGAERYFGYRDAHADAGIPLDEALVWDTSDLASPYRFDAGYGSASNAIAAGVGFRGILAASDELAQGAIAALHDNGLAVPNDVAVVGSGNVDWGAHVRPSLTTVSEHPEQIAREVCALFVGDQPCVQGDRTDDPPSCLLIERRIIERQST